MEMTQSVENWHSQVVPVLESKVYELKTIGYEDVTPDDLWQCLNQKVWKENEHKRLHEVVQDILHLPSSTYMSYLTVNAHKNDDLMASIAALTNDAQTDG